MAGSSPRRWYGPTVLGIVVAGGAAFVLGRRTWVTTTLGDGQGAGAVIETTGTDVSALVPGLAVVIVAAGLGVLAAGGWFRRVIGVLVVASAVGGVVATRTDPDGVVDTAVQESVAFGQGVDVSSVTHAGPWLSAAAFVLAALLGILVVRYGAAWPTMSSRYESPTARVVEPDGSDLWKAMDAGLDPTESVEDRDEDREADGGRPAG